MVLNLKGKAISFARIHLLQLKSNKEMSFNNERAEAQGTSHPPSHPQKKQRMCQREHD